MANKTKPIVVIVLAVAAAAAIATYQSRQTSASGDVSGNTNYTATPGGGHVRGNPSAPITLVEFGDYQCPGCGAYHPVVDELIRRYPDKVKLEFHHFPLIQAHPNALAAAMAVEAAGDQGKYWEMNDIVFERQREWSMLSNPDAQFLAYAGELHLDANKFMQSKKSPEVQKRISEDVQRASNAKVNSTPTFFINGRSLDPLPSGVDEFARIVDEALLASAQAPK